MCCGADCGCWGGNYCCRWTHWSILGSIQWPWQGLLKSNVSPFQTSNFYWWPVILIFDRDEQPSAKHFQNPVTLKAKRWLRLERRFWNHSQLHLPVLLPVHPSVSLCKSCKFTESRHLSNCTYPIYFSIWNIWIEPCKNLGQIKYSKFRIFQTLLILHRRPYGASFIIIPNLDDGRPVERTRTRIIYHHIIFFSALPSSM